MRKGIKVLLVVGCLVAVCALAAYLSRDQEPRYQGRSLTQWLLLYDDSVDHENRQADTKQAEQAIRAIGTNALPYLVEWMRYEPSPSPWRDKARDLSHYLPAALEKSDLLDTLLSDKAERRFHLAPRGFEILGPQAAPAIPDLTRLMNACYPLYTPRMAVDSLACIGTEALPPLLTALTNVRFAYPSYVAYCLSHMHDTIGTNIAPAVPLLVQCADDPSQSLAETATEALGNIALEPDISLPPILRALGSTSVITRCKAAGWLSRFGAQARPAVPALRAALNDTNAMVRACATNALLQIAPEVLTNAPAQ